MYLNGVRAMQMLKQSQMAFSGVDYGNGKGGNYESVIALSETFACPPLVSMPHCVLAHDVKELT